MQELKINEEFKNLIRPLTEDEFEALEENIRKDGCREPITVLEDHTIIDGHNRYKICRKHNIEYKFFKLKSLDTDADIKLWMLYNQIGKRNYTAPEMIEVGLKIAEQKIIRGKERQLANLKQNSDTPQTAETSQSTEMSDLTSRDEKSRERRALEEAAKKVGYSYGTLYKAKKLYEKATDATIDRLRKGEISVDRAYKSLGKKTPIYQKGVDDVESVGTKGIIPLNAEKLGAEFVESVLKRHKISNELEYILICQEQEWETATPIYQQTNLSFDKASKLCEKWIASKQEK